MFINFIYSQRNIFRMFWPNMCHFTSVKRGVVLVCKRCALCLGQDVGWWRIATTVPPSDCPIGISVLLAASLELTSLLETTLLVTFARGYLVGYIC